MIDSLVYAAVSGRVSPGEYVVQILEKSRRLHGLNAFISLADGARVEVSEQRRDDRLLAVPIAVKDNLDVAGFPCTAGTPALREWLAGRRAGAKWETRLPDTKSQIVGFFPGSPFREHARSPGESG